LRDASDCLDKDHFVRLKKVSEKLSEISPGNSSSKVISGISSAFCDYKYQPTNDEIIDNLLKSFVSVKSNKFSLMNESLQSDLLKYYREEVDMQYLLYLYYIKHSKDIGINTTAKSNYIRLASETGNISKELMESATESDDLKFLIHQNINSIIAERRPEVESRGENILGYVVINSYDVTTDMCSWGDLNDGSIYYDSEAIDKIYNKDKNLIEKTLNKIVPLFSKGNSNLSIKDLPIIVVTRGLFFTEFDAFILLPDGLSLVQDIFDESNYHFYRYEELPIGGGGKLTLNGQTYYNATLFHLLKSLNVCFQNDGKVTDTKLITQLKQNIIEKGILAAWLPKIQAN
jgi:hypothetical protein